MEKMKDRYDWVDYLRFIGMFYIYLGHFGQAAGKLYPFVFTFHVPMFFFISGLMVKSPKSNSDVLSLTIRSFKRIMIPYAVFSVIGIVFLTIKDQHSINNVMKMIEVSISGVRNNTPLATLWFFPCLFVVFVYYYVLNRLISSKLIIFIISLIIYSLSPVWFGKGIPTLFWNIDSAAYFLVFFSVGALLGEPLTKKWLVFDTLLKKCVLGFVCVVSTLYFVVCYFKGTFSFYKGLPSLEMQYFCFFFAAFLLFIPNIFLAKYLEFKAKNYNLSPLLILGKNTLALCGSEQMLKFSLVAVFGALGLKAGPHNPLEALLYTAFCFFIAYFSIVKMYRFFTK